jgi:DNA-binding GntR family transcriptional regulator
MAQQTEANDELRLSDIPEKHRKQLKREQCHELIGYMESHDNEDAVELIEQFVENWL